MTDYTNVDVQMLARARVEYDLANQAEVLQRLYDKGWSVTRIGPKGGSSAKGLIIAERVVPDNVGLSADAISRALL